MRGKSKAEIAKEKRNANKKRSSSTNAQARVGKSKAKFVKEQREKNLEKRKRANIKKSVDRPQQKQKPKSQLKKKIVKGVKDLGRGFITGLKNPVTAPAKIIGKKIKSAISGGGSTAKAATPKIVPKKKPAQPKNPKQMPKGKDSQIMKAERDRRARAKDKVAKKKERDNRADVKDAKRGGFITAKAAKTAGRKANEKVAANKKRKSDELVSRGRR